MIGVIDRRLSDDLKTLRELPDIVLSGKFSDRSIGGVFKTAIKMSNLKKIEAWHKKIK